MPAPTPPDRLTVRCAVTANPSRSAAPAEAHSEQRTLGAALVEYGKTVSPLAYWRRVRLAQGALEVPADTGSVKLLRDHDGTRVIGVMSEARDLDSAPYGVFRLGRTRDAEEAHSLISDEIITHVSVGYQVLDGREITEDGEDIYEVTRASLFEVSVVGAPADSAARIDHVTAQKGAPMAPEQVTEQTTETPTGALSPEQMTAVMAEVRAQLAPAEAAPVAAVDVVRQAAPTAEDGSPIVVRATDRQDPRIPTALGANGRRYSAGDYFAAYAAGVREGDWTRHTEIRQALQDETTAEVPGLLPAPIVGELLGRARGRRPMWDSLTARSMPMQGAKFSRPKITQHVKVDPQAKEKTQIASQKFLVDLEEVSKTTLAGGLDVSQQAIDWTSPSLLNELIVDFTRIYIARTDVLAATLFVAAAKGTAVEWDGTAATLNTVLATAAGNVYASLGPEADVFPNTIWCSVDMWIKLAGLTDTTNRPLLPQLGPTNATAQVNLANPESGLSGTFRWVVDKNLPAGTLIMGDREFTESYENGRRFLQAVRPDVLGLDLAYMGYVAAYFPYPESLVPITVAATPPDGQKAAK
ncbi:HK97 family phage prohead protease [Streptomyces sp. NPDC050095]|uniref:HK97 family phage prohead protease n=1 Tax=unclassified Streptomyces TaxID=2593676 RepID=UPI003413A383